MNNIIKKVSILISILIITFGITSCGGNSEANAESQTDETVQQESMPAATQLMLGTVKLEETDFAVTYDQSVELIPLWKAILSLVSSETTAQAEMDAVIASIQDTMTSDQMDEMQTMGLTNSDMTEVSELMGVEMDFGRRFGEKDPEMQAERGAMRESGGGPPEGFGQGDGPGSVEGITQEMLETDIAERGLAVGGGFGINTQLLEAIIAFLETKV